MYGGCPNVWGCMNIGAYGHLLSLKPPMTASKVGTSYLKLTILCMFCLLISQVMLYVSEDTNKVLASTLVGQTVWYAAHWEDCKCLCLIG